MYSNALLTVCKCPEKSYNAFMNSKKILNQLIFVFGAHLLLCVLLSLKIPIWIAVRTIFGVSLIIFVPGYSWTLALFDNSIDWVERIVFSLVISLATVPFLMFIVSKIGFPFSIVSLLIIVCLEILCIPAYFFIRKKLFHHYV